MVRREPLAARLRILRARRGLSMTDAAELAGVQRQTLARLERGEAKPHDHTLWKIARAYGVDVADLLTDEEPAALSPHVALGDLLRRAGTPTRWLALPEDQWQAEVSGHDKTGAGKRLLEIAREQIEELVAVVPYLLRGEDALGNPAVTPETVEAWQAAALRKIKTLSALKSMLDDPEVDSDQKGCAEMLASLYEGIGGDLENFSSQNFRTHDIVGERPVSGP